MIGRRKKAFHALFDLLRAIEADLDDLDRVREMNLLLLKEIMRAENNILRHKTAIKRLKVEIKTARESKDQNAKLREKIKRTEAYVEGYYRQRYIWKCFGDGLAFAYLDKFAIKHAFYRTEDYDVKPASGMMGGKSGLVNEAGCLLSALDHEIPAILCDLTNVLRYGDVCLLGASDPYLIEVKSSPKLNQRGKRQAQTLKRLQDFFETDTAENFRMPGITKRVTLTVAERNHEAAMNACIARAQRDGSCIVHPEPGLTYVALYGQSLPKDAFKSLNGSGQQIIFTLNEEKREGTWTIYQPFTRTIRDRQHLLDFVVGKLVLIVMFDIDALCAAMRKPGWEISFNEHTLATIQFHHAETGARIGVSRQFLSRIGFDFVSPAWVAESQGSNIDEINATLFAETRSAYSDAESDTFRLKMFGPDA